MFVTDCEYADVMRMERFHRYCLINDDGTYYPQRAVISDVELGLDEIMMKFNESDIWFIVKMHVGQSMSFQPYVNLINEMKKNPAYSNLFDDQAKRLRKLKIEQHKSEIRAEAKIFDR